MKNVECIVALKDMIMAFISDTAKTTTARDTLYTVRHKSSVAPKVEEIENDVLFRT